jgi:hypothetical protein
MTPEWADLSPQANQIRPKINAVEPSLFLICQRVLEIRVLVVDVAHGLASGKRQHALTFF